MRKRRRPRERGCGCREGGREVRTREASVRAFSAGAPGPQVKDESKSEGEGEGEREESAREGARRLVYITSLTGRHMRTHARRSGFSASTRERDASSWPRVVGLGWSWGRRMAAGGAGDRDVSPLREAALLG